MRLLYATLTVCNTAAGCMSLPVPGAYRSCQPHAGCAGTPAEGLARGGVSTLGTCSGASGKQAEIIRMIMQASNQGESAQRAAPNAPHAGCPTAGSWRWLGPGHDVLLKMHASGPPLANLSRGKQALGGRPAGQAASPYATPHPLGYSGACHSLTKIPTSSALFQGLLSK